ncbi:hypothetical protein [Metabacillus sp. 22489]|uniref:hypothetical protein n=1 Tax=Metabacillus sp. 22489 TaxID=3453928 RepID=UPI003F82E7D9
MNRKNRYKPIPARIVDIANVLDIQLSEPNIKKDPYMTGMANGLILALSIMEQNEPIYKEIPSFKTYLLHKLKLKFNKFRFKLSDM